MKPLTPFARLVMHFIYRLLASGDEDGSGSMSLGLGAVLAIVATPGALACFFLLDKYAHPRILMEGHRFDAYKQSANDEYFFIVLSITVIGLLMILRWNRLLPDRRDFANLAPLPISARDVFLANFIALSGLGFLFAVAVNGVSWLLYPAIVTFADGSLSGYLRVALSHFVAVFAASLFAFFAVFALVGLLMMIVPKRWFRSVSVLARLLLIVALLSALPTSPGAYTRHLPPMWFLGLYETIAGFATPSFARLGERALAGLLAAISLSLGAYALCYRRQYLRLAESLDLIGSAHHSFPLTPPGFLFRSAFERACLAFALKTLTRSEPHILFFGGYVGLALVLAAQNVDNVLAMPILISFFLLTGLRFVFDTPAVRSANWIFRSTTEQLPVSTGSVAVKLALGLTLPWQLLLVAPITAYLFGWRLAVLHTGTIFAITILAAELLFLKFRAIPFTCSVHPDIQRVLARILSSAVALLFAVPLLSSLEHWMLVRPIRFLPALIAIALGWLFLERYKRSLPNSPQTPLFEERPPAAFELLKLA